MLLLATGAACAQSTDGYHSFQVIPLVSDSGSFTQQFNFTSPSLYPVTITPRFYPGDGDDGNALSPVRTCPDVVIQPGQLRTFTSLRTLCPDVVEPSIYGFVTLQAAPSSDGMVSDIPVFAAFSRMSNPLGNGFTVEGFPAYTFTSGTTVVNGLRRLAAGGGSPPFQTNCFIGNMGLFDPTGTEPPSKVFYTISNGGTNYGGSITLAPGRIKRFLDIFAAAGMPAGDYNNLAIRFRRDTVVSPGVRQGLLTFCTVQDNGTYGADFRIGKVAFGSLGIASNDALAAREWGATKDALGRNFEIGPGNSANTHVVYLRHPDRVQCMLLDQAGTAQLTASAGLEMRVTGPLQDEYVGGNNATGTGMVFLGDKAEHDGYNNRYIIEVESNEQNTAATRPYMLYCSSGSGNSFGYDMIRYQEPVDKF